MSAFAWATLGVVLVLAFVGIAACVLSSRISQHEERLAALRRARAEGYQQGYLEAVDRERGRAA